ncbi:MAG: Polyribonucleotide nucleotidyltransferase [candidate division CPR1 bacterium GW2011_GWA2_42_17]|uniref:Polyribonucleotide nucleotidyltransferase n=1 Tax=candidate division CPR1 bacterium GW2011_GWA2_42_17 TaxID=1618341 RepID=A0A0G0Z4N3_9BACT|nr:MAG: Polyribonucleotide nucleotidyltransferase [candidate division CPR1 bacterium GW2011_GWA2_42_17]
MAKVKFQEIEFNGQKIILETGRLAHQANASVLARYGDTVVLATVCLGQLKEEQSFLPLTVDFEERFYAGGRIKSSRFVKREGRPSEESILTSRLIDRSIRPLFPKDFFYEVQIVITLLSIDPDHDPVILAMLSTFAALNNSSIPWDGPLAAFRIGYLSGEEGSFLLNPNNSELLSSDLDLVASVSREGVVMVEAGANQMSEETVIKALEFAQGKAKAVIESLEEFQKEAGKAKMIYSVKEVNEELHNAIEGYINEKISEGILGPTKAERESARDEFLEELFKVFEGKATKSEMTEIFDKMLKKLVRKKILEEGVRPDGRKSTSEIRPLSIEVGVLPRTHGSAVFQRGETQVLSTVTLASTSLELLMEGPLGEETRRYLHHYNFPPFSNGEVGRMGSPSRREIGHGALAERALLPVIPKDDVFPYTVRVVSEVLSSSGSTSMAATCGSTLSLMDAGVPILAPVSGVAMGLITDGDKFEILTDIQALEDYYGDMDFKVAGTEKGITALQMDIKVKKIKHEVMVKALDRAKEGRLFILEKMLQVLPQTHSNLSSFAPRITKVMIDPKKIGEVIGSGGKIIKALQEETNTVVDIRDDGSVFVSGATDEEAKRAADKILALVREVQVGEKFDGRVVRIMDFGAFVEVLPGKDGLVHISGLSDQFVENINDVVKVGDAMRVKVTEVDMQGRINLARIIPGQDELTYTSRPRTPRTGGSSMGGRSSGGRSSSGGTPRSGYTGFGTPYHQKPSYRKS